MQISCLRCDFNSALSSKTLASCPNCSGLLTVTNSSSDKKRDLIPSFPGVWGFREHIASIPTSKIISLGEGNTPLYSDERLQSYGQGNIQFKHEGMNPSGSFKDRGMTVAVSVANHLNISSFICASTGNTSASLAAYAAKAGAKSYVLLPDGKVATNKLAQAIGYGAQCIQISGDFDSALSIVEKTSQDLGICLVNSINPFRIQGQKTIIWELFANLNWKAPDWIIVPGGNLGNTSAFGAAIQEAHKNGWITTIPRLVTVQAQGASPFFQAYENNFSQLRAITANTIATAIQIGNPVNYPRAIEAIKSTNGLVTCVTDQEILLAKQQIDNCGIGCEPASACTLAGFKKLREQQIIKKNESAVGVLTGHILKDTTTILKNSPEIIKISYIEELQDIIKS